MNRFSFRRREESFLELTIFVAAIVVEEMHRYEEIDVLLQLNVTDHYLLNLFE